MNKISQEIIDIVMKRDNYRCFLCRSSMNLEIHHIIPRSHFSKRDERKHQEYNLCVLCRRCHSTAHTILSRKEILKLIGKKNNQYKEFYTELPWRKYND